MSDEGRSTADPSVADLAVGLPVGVGPSQERDLAASSEQVQTDDDNLRFVGGRFDLDGVHLEGLAELAAYQRIVIELARDLWRESYPDAGNMPNDFTQAFQLRMLKFKNGSFEAVLDQGVRVLDVPLPDDFEQRTWNRVDDVFERLTRGLVPEVSLSQESTRAIKKFGVTFTGQEGFEARVGGRRRKYDRIARKAFLGSLKAENRTMTGALVGRLFELNTDSKSFKFVLAEGREIGGHFDEQERWEDLKALLDAPASGTLVRLEGLFTANRDLEPLRIDDVAAVEVFAHGNDRWTPDLTRLAQLRPGWLDGTGEKIELSALELARDLLRQLPTPWSAAPALFPQPSGGVQIEWLTRDSHTELSITPDLLIEAHHYNGDTGESQLEDLVGADAALTFLQRLRRS